MRDLVLVAFFFIAIFYTFKRPVAGLCAWIWIALMAPTEWVFGFSQVFRLNLTIVLITALSYMSWKDKPKARLSGIHFWVFFFCFWMLVSTIFNNRVLSDMAWYKFTEFVKVIALFLFCSLTLKTKKDIDAFIWAIVLAVPAYAAMEAVKFILSAGGHRIVGKSGILADRNDLAVAINMCIPLVVYLWTQTRHKLLKLGLLGIALMSIIAIVGTYSRGGMIGLLILGFALWLRSDKKIVFAMIFVMALPVAYQFAPEEWKERQSTISTASTEDSSFIGRLWAWKIATLIALDDPLTGGGFKATTDPVLWNLYAHQTPDFGPIYTREIPVGTPPLAAHNIYFQVLASSGFVGLFIFLAMLLRAYLMCTTIIRQRKADNEVWGDYLSKAITLSLVGYGITGLNVSLAYFELLYALLAVLGVMYGKFVAGKHKQGSRRMASGGRS